jgi:hypothetical protein
LYKYKAESECPIEPIMKVKAVFLLKLASTWIITLLLCIIQQSHTRFYMPTKCIVNISNHILWESQDGCSSADRVLISLLLCWCVQGYIQGCWCVSSWWPSVCSGSAC